MGKNNIQKAYNTTRKANAIISEAGGVMFKTSIQTAKEIIKLYQDTGVKAFSLGRGMVQKTVQLTLNNHKELVRTSSDALKEVAQSLQEREQEQEVTIDDVLTD
ncbi:MAG: hypothetical protein AAF824_06830 [Bacteroidota bacterium]